VLPALAATLVIAGCGAKSGLPTAPADAEPVVDAGLPDVVVDASEDVGLDVAPEATPDVVFPPVTCPDAGAVYVYVVTEQQVLYRFDPPSSTFTPIGMLSCPTNTIPFSMGVDRGGTAWVLYRDGNLFRVSTDDASCEPTGFVPGQLGWVRFGMGFVADEEAGTDTLYVTDSSYQTPSQGLGKFDAQTQTLSFIGPYSKNLGNAVELTGTGDGRLYAFGLPAGVPSATVSEIDESSGTVLSSVELAVGNDNSSFAFAFWGGDFYLFVSDGPMAQTATLRYHPSDGSLTQVTTLQHTVVGAGVSTCAPH